MDWSAACGVRLVCADSFARHILYVAPTYPGLAKAMSEEPPPVEPEPESPGEGEGERASSPVFAYGVKVEDFTVRIQLQSSSPLAFVNVIDGRNAGTRMLMNQTPGMLVLTLDCPRCCLPPIAVQPVAIPRHRQEHHTTCQQRWFLAAYSGQKEPNQDCCLAAEVPSTLVCPRIVKVHVHLTFVLDLHGVRDRWCVFTPEGMMHYFATRGDELKCKVNTEGKVLLAEGARKSVWASPTSLLSR